MQVFNVIDYGARGDGHSDDTAAIQRALDAAYQAGGGIVQIPAGTFIVRGTDDPSHGALQIRSNTELAGAGMGSTVIKLADDWSGKISGVIRTPPSGEAEHDIAIRDLTVDGNKAHAQGDVDGIMTGYLPGSPKFDNNILIERVEVENVSRIGFNPHEQTHNLTIRDSVSHDNGWDGFEADYVSQAVYENDTAYGNGRHGFNVVTHSSDVVLRNDTSYGNGVDGIVVQRGSEDTAYTARVLVEGNDVYGNGGNGIELKRVDDSQVLGNRVHDNGLDGIHIEASNRNVIDGNQIADNSMKVPGSYNGITIKSYSGDQAGPTTASGNLITNNVVSASHVAAEHAFFEDTTGVSGDVFAGNSFTGTFTRAPDGTLADSATAGGRYAYVKLGDTRAESGDQLDLSFAADPTHAIGNASATSAQKSTGGAGADLLNGGAGNDALYGSGGNDLLLGRGGNDVIHGDASNDRLSGGAGNDTLAGGDGRDVLAGGIGVDTLCGGAGNDTFTWANLNEGGDSITDFRLGDRLDVRSLLPDFHGTPLEAALGGYVHFAQVGADVAFSIDPDGSAGPSLAMRLATLKNVSLAAADFRQVIVGDIPGAAPLAAGLNLTGTAGNDRLAGSDGDNKLNAGGGNDSLTGSAGADILCGGSGKDVLTGGTGNDFLQGGIGADTFIFAPHHGSDIVDGLTAEDVLQLNHALFATADAARAAITASRWRICAAYGRGQRHPVPAHDPDGYRSCDDHDRVGRVGRNSRRRIAPTWKRKLGSGGIRFRYSALRDARYASMSSR